MEDMAFAKFVAFCMMRVISFRFISVVIRSAIGAGNDAAGYKGRIFNEPQKAGEICGRCGADYGVHPRISLSCGCWLTSLGIFGRSYFVKSTHLA